MHDATGIPRLQRRVVGQRPWACHTPWVAASDDPEKKLRAALAKRQRAEKAVIEARAEERAAILAAQDEDGLKQADVVRITGYTRETIRRLTDAERLSRTAEAG
jgi:hypothetical protein